MLSFSGRMSCQWGLSWFLKQETKKTEWETNQQTEWLNGEDATQVSERLYWSHTLEICDKYLSVWSWPIHLRSSTGLEFIFFFLSFFFLLRSSSWKHEAQVTRSAHIWVSAKGLLNSDWLSYQLFLQVNGPDDSIVPHSENEEKEEAQLCVAHLSDPSVVKDWLPPVGKPVHQDVVVPGKDTS